MSETPADAALALAARGWSVVPVHSVAAGRCSCRRSQCPSPGKHPRVRWERRTTRAARPPEIEAWWDRWPDANVGVIAGWISAIVVVDIDPRHGGDANLAALEAKEQALPPTVTSVSGGGGRHFYFAHPTHLLPSRPLAGGIDLRAEAGLVVAPPSRHASGGTYQWLAGHSPHEMELAALPAWLDRLSVALDGPRSAGQRTPIARSATERATFADLWSDLGLDLRSEEFMTRCPFHDDHHPSLHIDPDGCLWFCFGCRQGGGIQALRQMVDRETERSPQGRSTVDDGSQPPTLAPDAQVDVVGESHHQDELLALTGGRRTWAGAHRRVQARLEPEDDNPYDPQAVAVRIEENLVGHLPRQAARAYRPIIEETIQRFGVATCLAEIRGGWERSHGDVGHFGVVVVLPSLARDQ